MDMDMWIWDLWPVEASNLPDPWTVTVTVTVAGSVGKTWRGVGQ